MVSIQLGQAASPPRISNEQLEAIAGLKNSWEHLEDFQRWVKDATPTTFEAIRRITTDKVVAELNWLNSYVVGKSGATEMEALLVDAWAKLSTSVSQPLPEIYEVWADKALAFLTYLVDAVAKVWADLIEGVKTISGPVMKKYWDMAVHVRELRAEFDGLTNGMSPADYSQVFRDQEAKILEAEAWVATIQGTFKAISGMPIDAAVQSEFGQYPQLGAAGWFLIVLAVAAVAGIIMVAYKFAMTIDKLSSESPWVFVALVGVITGIVVLPQLLNPRAA